MLDEGTSLLSLRGGSSYDPQGTKIHGPVRQDSGAYNFNTSARRDVAGMWRLRTKSLAMLHNCPWGRIEWTYHCDPSVSLGSFAKALHPCDDFLALSRQLYVRPRFQNSVSRLPDMFELWIVRVAGGDGKKVESPQVVARMLDAGPRSKAEASNFQRLT